MGRRSWSAEQRSVNAAFDPDDMTAMLVNVDGRRTSVVFVDAGGTVLLAWNCDDGGCCLWWTNSGISRPTDGQPRGADLVGNAEAAARPP